MSKKELRRSRYIENFVPPSIIENSVHQVCASVADVFLGQIEYGKDYVINTGLVKEDWADGFGTKYTYNLKFDELVRCRDCIRYSLDDYGNTWCAYVASAVQADDFCAWGEREDGDAR